MKCNEYDRLEHLLSNPCSKTQIGLQETLGIIPWESYLTWQVQWDGSHYFLPGEHDFLTVGAFWDSLRCAGNRNIEEHNM